MTRFVPGTKGLSDQVCSGYQGIECQGLFRVLRVWVLRFVPGTHFWVTTSTRNFQKKSIFLGEKKFSNFFLMFLGSLRLAKKHIKNFSMVLGSL